MTASPQAASPALSTLPDAAAVAHHVMERLGATPETAQPYPHWLVRDVLPHAIARAVTQLPIEVVAISETYGKRDSHNALRQFFCPERQAEFPVCSAMAGAFQSHGLVRTIETICRTSLKGSSLRIEYCQDGEGFWLEPHTDIGAKIFTMVLYLTEGAAGLAMGTDIYDADKKLLARAPSPFNSALIFVPGASTWHGFEKRPMPVMRKSLIINYVKPEWRARHELCFPETPV